MRAQTWIHGLVFALIGALTFTAAPVSPTQAQANRVVRELVLVTWPQAQDPQQYESARIAADGMRRLGLKVTVRPMPWEQLADYIWYSREKWDMTTWQMVGRPERSDPDELLVNLFSSSTAKDGYNFIGFIDSKYDAIAQAQREATDPNQRKQLVEQAQKMLADAQPYTFLVNPKTPYAYNNEVWDSKTIVEQKGIGIKNFWTFDQATPKGAQKDMVLNNQEPVKAINPLYISGKIDSWITELIWDRLVRVGPDGLPRPWAASAYKWVNPTTIDVTLRAGMKFHDGTPVTPEDVIFSFSAPKGDKVPMYKPFVANVKNIQKVDATTLRFVLEKPSAAFLTSTLGKLNIVPQHVWAPMLQGLEGKKENAESLQEKTPVGSGPFKFVSWTRNQEVVLEANPQHWAAPKMHRWILRGVSNVEAALGALRNGELNFLSDYLGDPSVLAKLSRDDHRITVVASTDIGMQFIGYNERRPPFNDVNFRRALTMVTDRNMIRLVAYKGYGEMADSPVSRALAFWHATGLPQYAYNVAAAKDLLKKAGYEWDGQGRLLYPANQSETLEVAR
ncbi:MAG TPA: ABC transporter substrate-binding protein [bacterium]|nr:ABC transporter substrate-binding protein [bacterium]